MVSTVRVAVLATAAAALKGVSAQSVVPSGVIARPSANSMPGMLSITALVVVLTTETWLSSTFDT